jgi:hypothetical protein
MDKLASVAAKEAKTRAKALAISCRRVFSLFILMNNTVAPMTKAIKGIGNQTQISFGICHLANIQINTKTAGDQAIMRRRKSAMSFPPPWSG